MQISTKPKAKKALLSGATIMFTHLVQVSGQLLMLGPGLGSDLAGKQHFGSV